MGTDQSGSESEPEMKASTPVPNSAHPDPTVGAALPAGIEEVASGLVVPWSLEFAPDGRIFITERTGRVRVIEAGVLREEPWAVLDVYAEDPDIKPESGLLGIALAPDFEETGHLYLMGTFRKRAGTGLVRLLDRVYRKVVRVFSVERASPWESRVYRLTDSDGRGTDARIIIDHLPAFYYHVGGALAFGPDGMLYLTTGDRLLPELAQDPGSLAGKILRYQPDGGIPEDNPIPGSPVYALGLRNPQGLAWHPETGDLFATDHGPTFLPQEGGRWGRDELNLISPGSNYGWPIVAGREDDPRFERPLAEWTPALAPGGLAFYTGTEIPAWRGNLFASGLRGQQLRRIVLEVTCSELEPWRISHEEAIYELEAGRIRAVRMGPDGHLYITTSNSDGRGVPDTGGDRLLRIVSADSIRPELLAQGLVWNR
jgi:glucose/arabinose dehydrogenase